MTIYSQSFDFSLVNCPVCSIPYGVLASMADRKGLTCPNGHSGIKQVAPEPVVATELVSTPIRTTGVAVGPVGMTATRLAQPEHQPMGPTTRHTPNKPPLKGRTLDIYDYLQGNPSATSDRLATEFACTVAEAGAALAYITRWRNMTSEQLAAQAEKLRTMRTARETVKPDLSVRDRLVKHIQDHPDTEFTRREIANLFSLTDNHASATMSILANRGVVRRIRAGVFQAV